MTDFETRVADWLTVEEAVELVLGQARPARRERLPLLEALGRVLAEPVAARATLPPWDNSAMDGYAVRAADVRGATPSRPVRLPVRGSARAGTTSGTALPPGAATRIMTGAPVPDGADSVVRVEDTDREAGQPGVVEVRSDRDAGRNVRPGGQDMRSGDVVLEPGVPLGPGRLAVAAAAGHAHVEVYAAPVVAVLSNGDELRRLDAWEDVARGEGIPETNGTMLSAAVRAAGAVALPPRLAPDESAAIRRHVEASLGADLLVTSGGASMGEADLLKRVMDDMGLELLFWRVRMRPGSPVSFGHLPRPDGTRLPVFGLPGNPASAFVTFELFVRPYLLAVAGHARVHRPVREAVAGEALPSAEGLAHFHRVTLEAGDGLPTARLAGHQGSGLVRSLGRAGGLAVVPRGVERVDAGRTVQVILLEDTPGALEGPGYRAGGGP